MKKLIKNVGIVALITLLLTGCSFAGNESVENEVSEMIEQATTDETTADAEVTNDEDVDADATGVEEEATEQESNEENVTAEENLVDVALEVSSTDGNGNEESTHAIEDNDVDLQIVFIGDSIFDAVRDETGIAKQVGEKLEADVYNLAIGGTSAGLRMDKSSEFDSWTEPTFLGIVYAMTGRVSRDILNGYKSGEVFDTCDFSETDYFIIEYGTNDFLNYIPLGAADYKGLYYNYFSPSLEIGLRELQKNYPNATIIMCTPYYEEFWSADRSRYIGDAHTVNNGSGTLLDYIWVVENAARDFGVTCLNMYNLLGINIENVSEMTVDGIHPSEMTRNKYADLLAQAITEIEESDYTTLDIRYIELANKKQEAAENAKAATEAAVLNESTENAD